MSKVLFRDCQNNLDTGSVDRRIQGVADHELRVLWRKCFAGDLMFSQEGVPQTHLSKI